MLYWRWTFEFQISAFEQYALAKKLKLYTRAVDPHRSRTCIESPSRNIGITAKTKTGNWSIRFRSKESKSCQVTWALG